MLASYVLLQLYSHHCTLLHHWTSSTSKRWRLLQFEPYSEPSLLLKLPSFPMSCCATSLLLAQTNPNNTKLRSATLLVWLLTALLVEKTVWQNQYFGSQAHVLVCASQYTASK
ncbi:hypothetical protein M758_6G056900 [Ceratodon purpureus]|nr:hypothetical protein M758_6G056900 [Ceratodon purpureus]